MWHFIILLLTLANHQKPSNILFFTTASKISFAFKSGGNYLDSSSSKDDVFAMNGQMFQADSYAPVGLYVENGKTIHRLNLVKNRAINFGINPQAVFYIDKNGNAGIVNAEKATPASYKYATQIAPMLLINGKVNPSILSFKGKCKKRNGLGITNDGKILMFISNKLTTFAEFAQIFKDHNCVSAAFIDAGISGYWTPNKESGQTFGVIIKSR